MLQVGSVLTEFRKARRLSQLDLSVLAEVSSRHISFIECGRSRPSREMLLRLADVLGLPTRDSNLLLSAAGFAMIYPDHSLDGDQMAAVSQGLQLLLDKHNPYPALVVDSSWNILTVNAAQQKVMELLPAGRPRNGARPLNLMHRIFDPQGFRPLISNWDELAAFLLRRLKRQVLMYSRPEHQKLLDELVQMNPPRNWLQPPTQFVDAPLITANFALAGHRLSVFSTITQFGTALDVGLQELSIESYFPADEQTRRFFEEL